jgi:hypothetical protein
LQLSLGVIRQHGSHSMTTGQQRDRAFEDDVVRQFDFIAPDGAPRVASSVYDPAVFGNAVVSLEGEALRVRVTRDRSQLLTDVSPVHASESFDEHVVLQLVGASAEADALATAEWRSLAPTAAALRKHYARIVEAFAPERWVATKAELGRLQEARADRLFGPLPTSRDRDPAV